MAVEELELCHACGGTTSNDDAPSLLIATILRREGSTGVHTHVRELRRYLDDRGIPSTLVTPFSWRRKLSEPVFGLRLLLVRASGAASVAWYRHWHEVFLRRALHHELANLGPAVVYAQGPVEAGAALKARRCPHQRVVMAVHFHVSQADEWVHKGYIEPDGAMFRSIRRYERDVIPQLDGIVYVSRAARDGLVGWLSEAEAVSSEVIPNFVETPKTHAAPKSLGDLVSVGGLELVKNQRFLIEVLAEAKKGGRELTLDLFGDGPCRRDLSRQARSLGVETQVRFRGFRPDVREQLGGYRAYVHSSLKDTGPLAIIEAMAAGLPVIAGQVGGIPELYEAGAEGWSWPLDDAGKAARILIDVLDSEDDRARAGVASTRRYRQHFDSHVVAPHLWSFLVATRAPRPAEPAGSGSTAINFQESFYNAEINYREGSPHLAHPLLYERLVSVVREQVASVAAAKLPLDVIEIGAGHGGFTEPMLAAGCRVTALEMSQASVSRLNTLFAENPSFECIYNPDGTLNCLTDDFSIAACVSVLHHIPDYMAALQDLTDRIRAGGSLVILQEPLWYPRTRNVALRLNRLGYLSWRVRQGSLRRGIATEIRRVRGYYDESNPSDMVEYHIVRHGVDEQAISDFLLSRFKDVRVIPYWSNQSDLVQKLGQRLGLDNTFGVVASGRLG
jgi:glycosyltransferase involved in cell wall biosynthesis/SAM-dependent methyltransferase